MRKLHSVCQVHFKRLNNGSHVPCSLQSPHSKGIGMITSIWNLPVNRSIQDTHTVTPLEIIRGKLLSAVVPKLFESMAPLHSVFVCLFCLFFLPRHPNPVKLNVHAYTGVSATTGTFDSPKFRKINPCEF